MSRRRLDVIASRHFPAYVVWELTLRCDHACTHCGSRAAVARDDELTTAEALRVVDELAALGAREVVLIGGEAYLHEGFLAVVAALARAGINPTMTTGGKGITAALAQAMAAAGLRLASVSIDGLRPTHDRMRASTGSFDHATAALGHLRAAGIRTAANTNLNRLNRGDLEPLYEHLRAQGIVAWQVQLTAPLGRAADRPAMILQPWDLVDLVPRLAALKRRGEELYINDGAYGALYDAAHVGWRFPVRCLNEARDGAEEAFAFYGPTCDDADYMEGPFTLPADIQPGDYIEVGMLGAYGAAMKTAFNGFGAATPLDSDDEPMASQYRGDRRDPRHSDNVVRLR